MRFLFPLLSLFALPGAAQDFRVQAAAFANPVDMSYFTDKGVMGVTVTADEYGIYRYFVGSYWTRDQAEVVQKELIVKGFQYATIVDLAVQRALAGARCPYYSDQEVFVRSDSIRNIFFETGRSELSADAKATLDEVAQILRQKKQLKLNLYSYTDNVGDAATNVALATDRSRVAREYLVAKGVKADRMFLQIYAEAEPGLEHRDFNGREIVENRKWNRRIKLVLTE